MYIPVQQQRPELPTVTLTWHACKYKVDLNSTTGTSSDTVQHSIQSRICGENSDGVVLEGQLQEQRSGVVVGGRVVDYIADPVQGTAVPRRLFS